MYGLIPQKPGVYRAASSSRQKWWDMVVDIRGEPPFLKVEAIMHLGGNKASDVALMVYGGLLFTLNDEAEETPNQLYERLRVEKKPDGL